MEVKNYFATDAQGNVLGSAQVYVYLSGTTTLATGIQSISGAALANPFTSQSNGLVQFKAPDNNYDLRVVKPGREFTIPIQCFDGVAFSEGFGALVDASAIPSYAALRLYSGRYTTVKIIDGFRTGRFNLVSTTPAGYTDDGGLTIIGANGWVWQRINVGEVHVDWYLQADWVEGVSNDWRAFERASQYQRAKGGGRVRFFRRHLLDQNTFVNDLVELVGPIPVGALRNGERDYQKRQGVIILNSAASVYMESSASIRNAIFVRKGMGPFPFADQATATAEIAAYAGTAVNCAAPDPHVENCMFLGFDQAIFSNGQPRARFRHIYGDCNNGIWIKGTFDVFELQDCHFWPFLCYTQGVQYTPATSRRPGAGYKVTDSDDWGRMIGCFAFGYERGFLLSNADSVTLLNCAADFFGEPVQTSMIGCEVSGTSKATSLIGFQSASQFKGLLINITSIDRPTVTVIGGQFWNNDVRDIHLVSGYLIKQGNFCSRAPISLQVDSTALGALVVGNRYDKCGTAPVTGDMTMVTANDNVFIDCTDNLMGVRAVNSGSSTNNRLETTYGGQPLNRISRRAGGTATLPTALSDGAVISTTTAQAHNGAGFVTLGSMRFQTRGAQTPASCPGAIVFSTTPINSVAGRDVLIIDQDGSLKPVLDATSNFGAPNQRINNSYFAVAPTVGSDERYKTEIQAIPDSVLDAWASIEYRQYKLINAVERKGAGNARLHVGLIAQRVVEEFKKIGLDAKDYGLLCHDAWGAEPAVEAVMDEDGQVIIPAREKVEAADRYSIRYEEALALESALMRRATTRLEERLAALEAKK